MKTIILAAAGVLVIALLVVFAMKSTQAPAKPAQVSAQPAAAGPTRPLAASVDTVYYSAAAWPVTVDAYILNRGKPTKVIPAGDPHAANELIWATAANVLHLIKSNKNNKGNNQDFLAAGASPEILLGCKSAKLAVAIFNQLAKTRVIKTPLRQIVVINPTTPPDTIVLGGVYINRKKLIPKVANAAAESNNSDRNEVLGVSHNPNYPGMN